MQRKFLTNLGFLLLLNLLIKPIYIFGIDRTVQNVVGAEDFGFYFAVFNFTIIFNILLDFGITNFNNKNIAQNTHLLNKHFSSIIILKFILALIYFVIIFGFGLIWGFRGYELWMLGMLGLNQFFASFILYLRSNISALFFFKTDSVISVLDRVLMIVICSVLLWGNVTHQQFRIEWFIYAQTFSYIITALVALSVVVKKASFRKLNWNTPFFLMIIKQSLPFALLVLLMAFYNRFDSVMIVKLLGDAQGKEQSGIYAHAFRLLDASNNFAYLFSVLLLPIFARLIKETQNVSHLVRLSFSLLFVVSVTFALTCWAFRLQITELMYFHLIEESAVVLGVLIFCFIPISTNYVFGTLLTANGNLKQLNIVAASGMIFNIGLNLWLIPQIGALGSAWASLVTQSIMAILQILLAALFFKFQFNVKYVLRLMLFCCGVVTIVLVMRNLNLDWIKAFLIANVLSMLLAMALGLLNITKFLGLFTGRLKNI